MSVGPTEHDSSSTADAGPSLADDLGAMFGDYVGSVPETSSTDAGAPPADSAPASSENATDGTEGVVADQAHAGAPPADASVAAPDTAVQDATSDDPLKDAAPFTYTVNGEQRTAEGIRQLGEYGAIVDADFLPTLQRVFTERDNLFERQQADYQRYQDLERLTAWNIKDAQGKDVTLTGRNGLEAQRTVLARTAEMARSLNAILDDPKQVAALVSPVQDEQGNIFLVWDKDAVATLRSGIAKDVQLAEYRARGHFSALSAPQPAPEPSVADLAMPTVEATVQSLGVTGLSAEDKQFLADQLAQYVRPPTAEERRTNPQLGARVVDASFAKLVQREAARVANTVKLAETATSTAKENAAKLAAAAAGKKPQGKQVARQTTPPVQSQRSQDASSAWDMAERASANAMRSRMRSA